MKYFIFLCVGLGIFHVQVDATPVTQTTHTYENDEANLQKQLQTFLSEMIQTANETKDSIVKMYARDIEYFEYRSKHVNEVMKKWSSSSNNVTNSSQCVAISAQANEYITRPEKKIFTNCLNEYIKAIERLKEEIVMNTVGQKNLFDLSNMRKDQAEFQDFRTNIIFKAELIVKSELSSLEVEYLNCIGANMSVNDDFWDFIEISVIKNCADKKFFEESYPLAPADKQYENENDLRKSLGTVLSNLNDVLKQANSSIAQEYEKCTQYGRYKINRTNEFIKEWRSLSHISMKSEKCNEFSKNSTQFIQNVIAAGENPYSYCFDEIEREFQSLKESLSEHEKDPLILAKQQLKIPTRQVAWQKFMYEQSYRIDQSARYWIDDKIMIFFECIEWKTTNLEESLNVIAESFVKLCARKRV